MSYAVMPLMPLWRPMSPGHALPMLGLALRGGRRAPLRRRAGASAPGLPRVGLTTGLVPGWSRLVRPIRCEAASPLSMAAGRALA